MGSHLINGKFQSDKYPTCPPGKVPLSVNDKLAQDLLWEYAQRRRAVDAEFSADLETALRDAGYVPSAREEHAAKVERERDEARAEAQRRGEILTSQTLEAMTFLSRAQRAEEALGFYATDENYTNTAVGVSRVWMDRGELARAILKNKPKT